MDVIAGYDAIVIRSQTKLDAELLERATSLRVIGRAGVGVDNIDVGEATRRGILVVNAPESTVISAAEHTIGLMLALSRNIAQAHASVKSGRWERSRYGGQELAGKTLGVLGFGRIGQQVARRALALGMHVLAFDPFVSRERFRELGVEGAASQEDVFASADIVSLHLPLTDETRAVVNAATLAHAKEGIRIVNAARGELVDEEALLEALQSGRVAAAALDVFSSEPYTGPLLELDNVVVTPHLAASTEEAQDRAGLIVAEQVAAALAGELVANAVNMPAVSSEELESLGPFAPLARRLGSLAMGLAGGRAERIVLSYRGRLAEHDTRLLTVAALNGVVRGPYRAAGERRQRGARRRRAWHRGRGAVRPLVTGLHEPRRGAACGRTARRRRCRARRSAARAGTGSSARSASGSRSSSPASWCSSSTTTGPA